MSWRKGKFYQILFYFVKILVLETYTMKSLIIIALFASSFALLKAFTKKNFR